MMGCLRLWPLLIASLLVLAGCTSKPVLNLDEHLAQAPKVSDGQVRQAVLDNLKVRGWSVTANSPGLIQAEITVRSKFFAAVDIPYSAQGFQIRYRDSRELNYKDGKIHRNYNRWVLMLDRGIVRELKGARTSGTEPDTDQ